MAEKVITEAFLRRLFLNGVPEVFHLQQGQILTPAGAEFLRDRRVPLEQVAPCCCGEPLAASEGQSPSDDPEARSSGHFAPAGKPIPVELSARHVHLSAPDVETLFGAALTPRRELSQPGQYLSVERVTLIGPEGRLENVAVLGPARGKTQVEISLTDARVLGVAPPLRQSGDVAGSPGLRIATARGTVNLAAGLIVPGRHIHMHPEDAAHFQVGDGERVRVRVGSERALTFEEVLVRVHPDYRLAMHIDFDEGNACGWTEGMRGRILIDRNQGRRE